MKATKIVHVVPSTSPAPKPDPIIVASLDQPEETTLELPKRGIELKLRPVRSLPQNKRAPRQVAALSSLPSSENSLVELPKLPKNVTAPPAKLAVKVETPIIVASLSEDQLSKPRKKLRKNKRTRKTKTRRLKVIAGGPRVSKRKKIRKTVRRKKRKAVRVASAKWKLRRSQWILR